MDSKSRQRAILGLIYWPIFTLFYWSVIANLVTTPQILYIMTFAYPEDVISVIFRGFYGASLAVTSQRLSQNRDQSMIEKIRQGVLLGGGIGALIGAVSFEISQAGVSEYITIARVVLFSLEGAIGMLFLSIIMSKRLD